MKLKYPLMRHQLQTTLLALSDLEYQYAIWVEGEKTQILEYVGFYISTENMLDNFAWEVGEDLIGICLRNKQELHACLDVVNKLSTFINSKPSDLLDEEYIGDNDWLSVIASSRQALRTLNMGDL